MHLLHIARYAWLTLARAPRFTVTAIVVLSIGTGAAIVGFVLYHALLVRPLAYNAPDHLVAVWMKDGDNDRRLLSPWLVQRVSEALSGVGEVGALRSGATAHDYTFDLLNATGGATTVRGSGVTANLFDLLGSRAAIGRTFRKEEGLPDSSPVVVLGYAFWMRQFNGDPRVLGTSLRLRSVQSDRNYEIVGIMPQDFRTLYRLPHFAREEAIYQEDVWIPVTLDASQWSNARRLWGQAFVRVASNEGIDAVREILRRKIPSPTGSERPEPGVELRVVSLQEDVVGEWRPVVSLGSLATLMICALATVNVTTLCALHFRQRRREMAVLATFGATTGRLAGIVCCSVTTLAVVGSLGGLLIAYVSIFALVALLPPVVPRIGALFGSSGVWLFASGMACLVSFVMALAVIAEVIVADLVAIQGNVSAALVSWRRRNRLVRTMVGLQVCLATVLLIAAGLLLSSLVRLVSIDVGFSTAGVLTATVELKSENYRDPGERWRFQAELHRRLSARADGGLAALTNSLPYVGVPLSGEFLFDSDPVNPAGSSAQRAVSSRYFDTLRIPLIEGRAFTDDEVARGDAVCIVSEAWRRRYSQERSPLGRRVMFRSRVWRTIIGVAGNVREETPRRSSEPTMYAPFDGEVYMPLSWVIKTATPETLARDLPAIVRQVDATVPVSNIRSLTSIAGDTTQASRLYALACGTMGLLATLMAGMSTYTLVAEGIRQRESEIAIRLVVGAAPAGIQRMVLREIVWVIVPGAIGGLAIARGVSFVLERFLYEVRADDVATYLAVACVVAWTAFISAYRSAHRVTGLLPMSVLARLH